MLSTACPKPSRTPPRSRRPLKKSGRPKAVNRKRRARLFREDFGSKAYLEEINAHSCAICGVTGWTVPAHTKARGAGGKVDDIVPLCCSRLGVIGCHERFDDYDEEARSHELRLRTLAKKLWKDWNATQTRNEA